MIRTRDFLLYVLVLLFLVMAISVTLIADHSEDRTTAPISFSEPATPEVVSSEVADPRLDRLSELKAKLAAGDGEVISAPPVFTSVDTPVLDGPATDTVEIITDRQPQYCGAALPHVAATSWPADAAFERAGDQILLTATESVERTVGTTTTVVREQVQLATIPVRTVRSLFDSCMPDTTVGVTTSGQLIDNRMRLDAPSSNSLIGYSRDGFAIYGPLEDESELDVCGGLYRNFVYQYHVRPGEPFVLGCYAGIPADLNI